MPSERLAPRMPPTWFRPQRVIAVIVVAAIAAYVGVLQVRANDREPALVVLWTANIEDSTVRHPRTGLAGWAILADVEEFVKTVESARGWRLTERLHADSAKLTVRTVEVGKQEVALVELPLSAVDQLEAALAPISPQSVVIIATQAQVSGVLLAAGRPVSILPGAWSPGVADGGETKSTTTVVGPWVSSRRTVGLLSARFAENVEFTATAVELPLRPLPATAPSIIGAGLPSLDHDSVRFERSGLGEALLADMLAETGADIALLNFLALRGALTGPVDYTVLERALPFRNEVILLTLDSAALSAALEQGAGENTQHLLVQAAVPLPSPLPERLWRVATVDYLANGGRGNWEIFTAGKDRIRTRIVLDDLAIDRLRTLP